MCTSQSQLPIAIVGIAAQLPSGEAAPTNFDHNEFFDFLLNKGEAYEPIPKDRFNIDSYKGEDLGQVCTELGTFLKHTDQIDHVELGITAKDAKAMSLSTRKLIELGFLALLDSGIDYRGRNVGCFASGIVFDTLSLSEPDEFEARGSFSGPPAMIANRISYHLDLLGPSVPVDTACSSSLTATHLAVQSISTGDCDTALVGGIQLNHRFVDWIQYSQGGILSPDGKCKPFDAAANGFSRGEAGIAIVLKRLDKASEDGDRIYATILGTGINSTGSAAPVYAPVAAAQRDAMKRAWTRAGRDPKDVDFVEVHATGTAAGDPTEANWVGQAFKRDDPLLIGSVKGNIGHTEIAAFLASLTKSIHIFRNGIIPPNANFSTPNSKIRWDEYRLRVPTEPTPLSCRSESGRSLIALCGSGIGGSNGHVVLEAPPRSSRRANDALRQRDSSGTVLLMAGGLSPRSTASISDAILDLISDHPDLSSFFSAVYGRRSRQMTWRSFAVLSPGLGNRVKFSTPALVPRIKPPVVFVFSGQGPQHIRMGQELFAAYAVFRDSILEMDAAYAKVTGESLVSSTGLFSGCHSTKDLGEIWPIQITLPALAMLQCALVDLLASLGINPDMVIGHSAGETAVLYASGAASKVTAVELAIARGQAMSLLESAGGTMAALSCGPEMAHSLVQEALEPCLVNTVDIGCHNSRDAVTLSGLSSSIEKVISLAKSRNIMAQKLRTRIPVHSSMMELCAQEFTDLVDKVWKHKDGDYVPKIPVYSTLTGALYQGNFNTSYFWKGTRGAVLFTEAVTSLITSHPTATFLEVSPHPVLVSYLRDLGANSPISSLSRPKRNQVGPAELPAFLECLGKLTCLGHNQVDFSSLNGSPPLDFDFPLPRYPFAPKTVPYHSEAASFYRQFQVRNGPLNHPGLRLNAQTHPVLAQHIIKDEPIMPAAGYIEMALEFGATVLWDVEFRAMMSLSSESPVAVEVTLDGLQWSVRTATASISSHKTFDKTHAEGYLSLKPIKTEEPPVNLEEIKNRCDRTDLTDFYEELKTFAEYGEAFRRVVDAYEGENEVLVLVRGDDDNLNIEGYRFHPAILDSCLHYMVHKSFTLNHDSNVYYLPSKVGKLVLHPEFVEEGMPDFLYTHIVYKRWTPNTIVADFYIVAIDGTHLCTLTDVEVERHESAPLSPVSSRHDLIFQPISSPSRITEKAVTISSKRESLRNLYRYMDSLAVNAIKNTLRNNPITGSELNRKRYSHFADMAQSSFVEDEPPDTTMIAQFRRNYPEVIEVTERVALAQANIFETSKAAVEVLYKDDILTRFYQLYDWASLALADRFRSLVKDLSSSGKRVYKVLEVGAGTGALTRHLVNVMKEFPNMIIEFVVSDVSKELLPRMDYSRCQYKSFNLSKSPAEQGLQLGSFDAIFGFHVLHVVPEMQPSLDALNSLLVPGGSLLIGDLRGDSWASRQPGSIWFDFVFGSFAEWFSFTDGRSHCTMSPKTWSELLHKTGFEHVYSENYEWDSLLFTLEAQKLPHDSQQKWSAPTLSRTEDKRIFFYRRGNEGELRKLAVDNDATELSLWLFTNSELDVYAGMGFSRSLAREFPLWDIHFIGFAHRWTEERMWKYISRLNFTTETVIMVDEHGAISVPRIIPSSSPSGKSKFDPNASWIMTEKGVTPAFVTQSTKDHVIIDVVSISQPEGKIRGFVGRVSAPATDLVEGQLVMGVTIAEHVSNQVSVPASSLARLSEDQFANAANISGSVLGLTIVAIALGCSTLRRRQLKSVLLAHSSDGTGPSVRWFLSLLGAKIVEVKSDVAADLAHTANQVDIVLSGSQDASETQVFASTSSKKHRRVFFWNNVETGLSAILGDDPASIGEALEYGINIVAGRWFVNNIGMDLRTIPLPLQGTLVPSSSHLFDPHKAYLLIGGIGGLGIRVALWMYQKGARYLVLTSRSGKGSLTRVQDKLAIRMIEYLENLPDLTIRLEASDATSCSDTARLLDTVSIPLGGCMLLTAVLIDRAFVFQTNDSFDKVFASKPGACKVLDQCIRGGLASLDFFIPFSSVVGLLGNRGQTNYSSANTTLDGIARSLPNSFSFILPAVSDGGGLASETNKPGGRLGHLTPWGMSSRQICDCLEDGIRKLADGPFWQYIPDLKWSVVEKHMEKSPIFSHMVEAAPEEGNIQNPTAGQSIADVVMDLLEVDPSDFDVEVPFTAYGLDSLSAARLSLALRPFLVISQLQLLSDVSLSDLERRIEKTRGTQQEKTISASTSTPQAELSIVDMKIKEMQELIERYSRTFPVHAPSKNSASLDGEVILITGTTGAIGSAMLAQLEKMDTITRIYAFNRKDAKQSTSLYDRQAASLTARGYDVNILSSQKIVLVEGDQTKYDLGISKILYEEIKAQVTTIIHNAWPVNFTATLASLEPSVRSVRAFIDLALNSPRPEPPRLLFLSSIGLLYNRSNGGPAPEERILDAKQVVGTGYTESKWIGERILEIASERTPLRPIIVRAGQICGGPSGAWNTTEWFPTLVKSAVHLGSLPDADGDISWIPLDTAAAALIEMRHSPREILHLSHPRPIPWKKISQFLSNTLHLSLVSYAEWLKLLEASANAPEGDENPALRLLSYFRGLETGNTNSKEALGLPRLGISEAKNICVSLQHAIPLSTMDVASWINNWKKVNFLDI